MACGTSYESSPITLPPAIQAIWDLLGLPDIEIDATWVQFVFQALVAYLLLEEQKEAEAEMEKIANCSIMSAEQLYDAYYDLREYDEQIFDIINEQPSYVARDVKAIQAKREATRFLKQAMGSTSRFDCGVRDEILRDTLRATTIANEIEQENLEQQEILTEDTYYENCILAKIGIASGDMPNISQGFITSGALWGKQFESARADAVGAVAGLAYTGSGLLGSFLNPQPQFQVGGSTGSINSQVGGSVLTGGLQFGI